MKQVEHTNSEREMLARVRHPFLVNLWGTFQDVNNLYMVMDFVAGGELFSLLRKSQVSTDPGDGGAIGEALERKGGKRSGGGLWNAGKGRPLFFVAVCAGLWTAGSCEEKRQDIVDRE